jgi:hypothetical protein
MVTVLALITLAACPDEKPIDLSGAESSRQELPAAREPLPPPRPTMPAGRLPVTLPYVVDGPTLALAPEIVIFDHNILRTPTSSTNPYAGIATPYVRPTSLSPVGVAGRLDDSAAAIALFVNNASSAIDTLYLLDDLKASQVALATDVGGARRGQLPYQFGAADPTVRDRLQLDVSDEDLTIGEETFEGKTAGAMGKPIRDAVASRRAQSTVGIEARVGIRAGTTNQRMVQVLELLRAAKVEAVYLYPVQDATAHSSTGFVDRSGGVPTVHIGNPNAQGDLDKAIIRRYIKRNIQKITYCYEKELLTAPDLEGVVSTQFFITPDGKVASSSGSGVSARVSSCVANVIKDIEFPKPKGGGGVQVNFPFIMKPSGG